MDTTERERGRAARTGHPQAPTSTEARETESSSRETGDSSDRNTPETAVNPDTRREERDGYDTPQGDMARQGDMVLGNPGTPLTIPKGGGQDCTNGVHPLPIWHVIPWAWASPDTQSSAWVLRRAEQPYVYHRDPPPTEQWRVHQRAWTQLTRDERFTPESHPRAEVAHVLRKLAVGMLRQEGVSWEEPVHEAQSARRWDNWALKWYDKWVQDVFPMTKEKRRPEETAEKKAGMVVLNTMRARNATRWLIARVAMKDNGGNTARTAGVHYRFLKWQWDTIREGEWKENDHMSAQPWNYVHSHWAVPPTMWIAPCTQKNRPTLYALRYMGTPRTYVGATHRKPGTDKTAPSGMAARLIEHLQDGNKAGRGYVTKKKPLPMYRLCRRWEHGLSTMIQFPMVQLQDSQRTEEGHAASANKSARTVLLALEARTQRILQPRYVYPWCEDGKRALEMRRFHGETRSDRERETVDVVSLVTQSGEVWDRRREWDRQYQKRGLRLNTDAEWSESLCGEMIARMMGHGKQASATYRVLRHASDANLRRVCKYAAMTGRKAEQRVRAHIDRATHSRIQRWTRTQVTVPLKRGTGPSTWDLVKRLLEEPELRGLHDHTALGVKRARANTVAEVVRTDIAWQGRLHQNVQCACPGFIAWLHRTWGTGVLPNVADGHAWITLQQIMERSRESATHCGEQTDGQRWAAAMGVGTHRKGCQELTALQNTRHGNREVIETATRAAVRALAQSEGNKGKRPTAAERRRMADLVGQNMARTMAEAVTAEEQTPTADDTRRMLKYRGMVCGPLDKGRHCMRYICPVTAWKELWKTTEEYCERGGTKEGPKVREWMDEWNMSLRALTESMPHCNLPMPTTTERCATARTMAKAKDPMGKFRLVVGTHKLRQTKVMQTAATAWDKALTILVRDRDLEGNEVGSLMGVRDALQEAQREIATAWEAGHGCMSVRKYDFVAFFQVVKRADVALAVRYWRHQHAHLYPARKVVQLEMDAKSIHGNRHPRAAQWKPGAGFHPRHPGTQFVRGGQAPNHARHYPLQNVEQALEVDGRTVIQVGLTAARQTRGLTIGSIWGGVGARTWALHREAMARDVACYQPRLQKCPYCDAQTRSDGRAVAQGTQYGAYAGMRWVDDRWAVVTACCEKALTATARAETLRYSGYAECVQRVLRNVLPIPGGEDKEDGWWEQTQQRVRSFLGNTVKQTRESVYDVVGMDVAIWDRATHTITPVPGWGEHMEIRGSTTIVTRPTTKDGDLMEAASTGGKVRHLQKPRMGPRHMDPDRRTTTQTLAATMVRFADMTNPRWQEPPDEGRGTRAPVEWMIRPWKALAREAQEMGWRWKDWKTAACKVGHTTQRGQQQDARHRCLVIGTLAGRAWKETETQNGERHGRRDRPVPESSPGDGVPRGGTRNPRQGRDGDDNRHTEDSQHGGDNHHYPLREAPSVSSPLQHPQSEPLHYCAGSGVSDPPQHEPVHHNGESEETAGRGDTRARQRKGAASPHEPPDDQGTTTPVLCKAAEDPLYHDIHDKTRHSVSQCAKGGAGGEEAETSTRAVEKREKSGRGSEGYGAAAEEAGAGEGEETRCAGSREEMGCRGEKAGAGEDRKGGKGRGARGSTGGRRRKMEHDGYWREERVETGKGKGEGSCKRLVCRPPLPDSKEDATLSSQRYSHGPKRRTTEASKTTPPMRYTTTNDDHQHTTSPPRRRHYSQIDSSPIRVTDEYAHTTKIAHHQRAGSVTQHVQNRDTYTAYPPTRRPPTNTRGGHRRDSIRTPEYRHYHSLRVTTMQRPRPNAGCHTQGGTVNLCEGQGREGRGSNGYGTRTTENSGSNGRKNKGQCTKMQTLYKVDASTGEDGMNERTGGRNRTDSARKNKRGTEPGDCVTRDNETTHYNTRQGDPEDRHNHNHLRGTDDAQRHAANSNSQDQYPRSGTAPPEEEETAAQSEQQRQHEEMKKAMQNKDGAVQERRRTTLNPDSRRAPTGLRDDQRRHHVQQGGRGQPTAHTEHVRLHQPGRAKTVRRGGQAKAPARFVKSEWANPGTAPRDGGCTDGAGAADPEDIGQQAGGGISTPAQATNKKKNTRVRADMPGADGRDGGDGLPAGGGVSVSVAEYAARTHRTGSRGEREGGRGAHELTAGAVAEREGGRRPGATAEGGEGPEELRGGDGEVLGDREGRGRGHSGAGASARAGAPGGERERRGADTRESGEETRQIREEGVSADGERDGRCQGHESRDEDTKQGVAPPMQGGDGGRSKPQRKSRVAYVCFPRPLHRVTREQERPGAGFPFVVVQCAACA